MIFEAEELYWDVNARRAVYFSDIKKIREDFLRVLEQARRNHPDVRILGLETRDPANFPRPGTPLPVASLRASSPRPNCLRRSEIEKSDRRWNRLWKETVPCMYQVWKICALTPNAPILRLPCFNENFSDAFRNPRTMYAPPFAFAPLLANFRADRLAVIRRVKRPAASTLTALTCERLSFDTIVLVGVRCLANPLLRRSTGSNMLVGDCSFA